MPFDHACLLAVHADASRLRLLLLPHLCPVSSGSSVVSLDLGVSFLAVCFLWRGLCTPVGGVCRFLFLRQVIPYPLDIVCQGLLPKGEYHHWQVFFPLKEVFPAVSLLSPMSGCRQIEHGGLFSNHLQLVHACTSVTMVCTSLESKYSRTMCVALVTLVLDFAVTLGLKLKALSLLDDAHPLQAALQSQMSVGGQPKPARIAPVFSDFSFLPVFLVASLDHILCSLMSKLPQDIQRSCACNCAQIQPFLARM